ncbi:MAG: serine/threonine-protein kinase [Gemmatimonadota bacterium]
MRSLFEEALERPVGDRDAFLADRCGTDKVLRSEVEALLAGAETDGFLGDDLASLAARALHEQAPGIVGTTVGPFRLTERIGEGGMGQVFVGERDDGAFRQRVAVKLIGSAFATPELLARFERERAILASLNHPNIAHLLDGGVSEYGPYLAMELVENAATILKHADERRLSVEARVELFASVCDAVHAAHQQLIVHRDLKPSNVLVTDDGRVKLLDFGIAGLLDDGAEGEPLTRTGRLLMTPEYASPEQLRGHPVSTASDIYSLGVMFYELLAGQRAYDLRGMSPGEIERRVTDGPITRPSEAVSRAGVAPRTGGPIDPAEIGAARSTNPDKLRRALRGDLDTIVQKAMHRDPGRRYASASAFAEDLRRHVQAQPVLARPDTISYRLSTFARRRRGGVIAAGLVALAVVVGAGGTMLQAKRADSRFDETRELATSMLSELNSELAGVPGSTPVRARLVEEALRYLDELSSDPRADRGHLLDVADAYDVVGELQGDPTNTNLGDLAAARDRYEQAMQIRLALWNVDSTDARTRRSVAESHYRMAVVTAFEGDLQESTRLGQLGLAVLAPLEVDGRAGDAVVVTGGRLRGLVGEHLVNDGAWELGPAMLDTAIVLLEGAVARRPDDVRLVTDLWDAYNGRVVAYWYMRRAAEGLRILDEKACPMLTRLVADHPRRADALYSLQQCHDYRGQAFEQLGRATEAESSHRESIALAEELLRLDDANETAYEAVLSGHVALGRILFPMGRVDEGGDALRRAAEVAELLRERNPSNGRWVFQIGHVQRELCRSLLESGNPGDALPACLTAVQAHGQAATMGPGVITDVTHAFALGQAARTYHALARSTSDPAESQSYLSSSIDHYEASLDAYGRVGDLGPAAAYEIHPDTVAAELARLRAGS